MRILEKSTFLAEHWAQHAFEALKITFTLASVLVHAHPTKPYILEMNALDFVVGAILSYYSIDNQFYPIAIYSWKFTAIEIN